MYLLEKTIPNRGACSANSSYCRYDGIVVSFQEKRDDLCEVQSFREKVDYLPV